MRYVADYKQTFETMILPDSLTRQVMKLAHSELGHNGYMWTCIILHKLYNWKALKPSVYKYVRQCHLYQK